MSPNIKTNEEEETEKVAPKPPSWLTRLNPLPFGNSATRLLRGNPRNGDLQHNRAWEMINPGDHDQPLAYFEAECTAHAGAAPYKTLWGKSEHGVYTVARCRLPNTDEVFYVTLFSRYPAAMARLLLDLRRPGASPPFHDGQVRLIGWKKESEITTRHHRDAPPGFGFRWVREAIEANEDYENAAYLRHGIVVREEPVNGDYLYQGGAHLYWLEKAEDSGEGENARYHLRYYCNPYHKQECLVDRLTLSSPKLRDFLRNRSMHLTDEPVSLDEAYHQVLRPHLARAARALHEGGDPYLEDNKKLRPVEGSFRLWLYYRFHQKEFFENNRYNKDTPDHFPTLKDWRAHILFQAQTKMLRMAQGAGTRLHDLGWGQAITAIMTSATVSIAFYVVTSGLLLYKPAAAQGAHFIKGGVTKMGGGMFKALSQLIKKNFKPLNEAENIFINQLTGKPEMRIEGRIPLRHLHPEAAPALEALPMDILRHNFTESRPLTDDTMEEWAIGKIVDTLGCPLGTVYRTEQREDGHCFLVADQPDGYRVTYRVPYGIAKIEETGPPCSGHRREQPIVDLLEKHRGEDTNKELVVALDKGSGALRVVEDQNWEDLLAARHAAFLAEKEREEALYPAPAHSTDANFSRAATQFCIDHFNRQKPRPKYTRASRLAGLFVRAEAAFARGHASPLEINTALKDVWGVGTAHFPGGHITIPARQPKEP